MRGGGTASGAGEPDIVLVARADQENMSLGYLAAACAAAELRAEVLVLGPTETPPHAADRILAHGARVVGLSMACQALAPYFLDLAARLRECGFDGLLCAGGHFATLAAERILADGLALDLIVHHEGEQTLVELLRSLPERGAPRPWRFAAIAGVSYRTSATDVVTTPARPLASIDTLPWPRRAATMPRVLGIPLAQMIGGRGCYAACAFCSIVAWHGTASGPRFRQRSVSDVAAEMVWLHRERGVRIFNFQDDTFFVPAARKNHARFRELADELATAGVEGVALSLKCRPCDVDDDCLDELGRIGLLRVYAGIETASEQGLRTLARGLSAEDNARALDRLGRRKIMSEFNLLLFDPDTTLESIVPNLELIEAYAHVPLNFCRTVVYTGTAIEQRLRTEHRLRGSYLAWGYDLLDPRADRMARISDVVFHHRNFRSTGMAHLNREMRFELATLTRFFPEIDASDIERAGVELSRRLAHSSLRHLHAIRSFAAEADHHDRDAVQLFAIDQARQVHREDFALLGEVGRLRREIDRRANAGACQSRPHVARGATFHPEEVRP